MKIKKKIKKVSRKMIKMMNKFDQERLKKPLILMTLIFLMLLIVSVQNSGNFKIETGLNYVVPENQLALENKIRNLTKGHPIERMATHISRKDEKTAAFLVAIAKKESNWGEHVPVLDGRDCFNYWGYRGIREKMGSEGHTCFNSPRDAVNTVSKRLSYLIEENGIDTPEELVIWKCGSNCDSQNQENVDKWVADVSLYYDKMIE